MDVNSVLGLLHYEVMDDVANILEVLSTIRVEVYM
jgi:hypothetical protein